MALGACDQPRSPAPTEPLLTPTAAVAARAVLNSEPIGLERIVVTIRPGAEIGSGQQGCAVLCPAKPIYWDAGNVELSPQSFSGQFFDTMTAAGYRVVGNPRQLFDREAERASARLLVGAQITEIAVTLDQINWAFSGPSSKGDARLQVAWQVYSLRDRRVIYETTTAGSGTIHRAGFRGAMAALLHNAFADATAKLSMDRAFQAAVTTSDTARAVPASAEPVDTSPFEIPRFRPFAGPASARLADLQGSAVAIVFEQGHGSGFFISDDGLILTNRHVVGDADQVNVRLLSGIEMTGRVLRRNALRDVALVKVDLARVRPLPVRTDPIAIGAEVFAVGAPGDAKLAGTVTRGIVSAIRSVTQGGVDLTMIQSDAIIHPGNSGGPLLDGAGNVAGIAVSAPAPRGRTQTGVSYFIPIDDALRYLNMRLGAPREFRF